MSLTPRNHINAKINNIRNKYDYQKSRKMIYLSDKIEKAMYAKSLTKIEFSNLMKVQPSVITKWLSGKHNFTIDTLFRIEDVLNIQLIAINQTT